MQVRLDHPRHARDAILSSLPASRADRIFAVGVVAVLAALFIAAVPFAKTPLAPVHAFIPAYQSALVVLDLITAVLLFEQLRYMRSVGLLALACGYVFTGVIAVIHALTFPGLAAPGGLLGAGPQTTAWLYMAWHAVFPLCVIAYAFALKVEFASRWWLAGGIVATLALAAGLTAIATVGRDALPPIMSGGGYTPAMIGVVGTVWALSAAALVAVWYRRTFSVLDVWLMVVMWAWIFDIALSAVLNGGRFDLGFYAGRIYGLLAAGLVLAILLLEHGRLYRRVLERTRQLDAARAAAERAEQAKGEFLATMSHEIRTPMNGVMGMLELMAASRLDGEQRTRLEIVRESGRSLLRILDDVLDFSRIEAGRLELQPQPASVTRLVERVHGIYAGNAGSKGIVLTYEIDSRIDRLLDIDALRVGQILNNLVSNAIKFTQQGSVTIRADLMERFEAKDLVRFTVADTGCGISPADRAKLFEPFTQAGTLRVGGTGLGLSICRRLAALMDGRLEMDSTEGAGTRVTLTLPLAVAQAGAEAATVASAALRAPDVSTAVLAPSVEEARAEGTLLLVVDDHPVNRMVLVGQLNALGFAAETANNGLEAIERWSAGGHALILTDCRMPEMDGYELTRHIRASEAHTGQRRVPIVACTASAMESETLECLASGMDDYLVKPVDLAGLARKLEQWMPPAAPIKPEVLAVATRGDPAREREVLGQFRRFTEEDARNMRAAVQSGDLENVAAAAHRIKGSSLAIGAALLAESCARLEKEARAGNAEGVAVAATSFERELARVATHISATESTA